MLLLGSRHSALVPYTRRIHSERSLVGAVSRDVGEARERQLSENAILAIQYEESAKGGGLPSCTWSTGVINVSAST